MIFVLSLPIYEQVSEGAYYQCAVPLRCEKRTAETFNFYTAWGSLAILSV